jgi:predicted dehydrogenase
MIRVGLVGLDSTHAVAFTELFNASSGPCRVTLAAPGLPTDFLLSVRRREAITREVTGRLGLPLADSPEHLVASVDAILILSADGRRHLDEARLVLPAGKPVFIDKPLAASARDGAEIFRLAREHRAACFSASALRFSPAIVALRSALRSDTLQVVARGPAGAEPFHPDLSWYGIHTVEALYTVMGPGCRHVTRATTPDAELVTGVWSDGRIGKIACARTGQPDFEVTVDNGATPTTARGFSYAALVAALGDFFATQRPPVAADETLEILRFIDAADESKARGGATVSLAL